MASMSSSKTAVIAGFAGLVLGAILASALMRQCEHRDAGEVETITDTLVIRDTVTERYPVPVQETVTDTMLVPVMDTVKLQDTAYIVLGRTQRYYRGPDYEAWVSGYRPRLDSLRVFPQTCYVTQTMRVAEKEKKNRIALVSSASWCNDMSLIVSLEYTHSWKWLYIRGEVGYDVISKSPYVGVRAGIPLWNW